MRVYTLSDMRSEKKLRVYTASESQNSEFLECCKLGTHGILTGTLFSLVWERLARSIMCSYLEKLGRKAVGPVFCVMHIKEPRTLIVKEKGLALEFLDSRLEHPAGWICACYKSFVLLY